MNFYDDVIGSILYLQLASARHTLHITASEPTNINHDSLTINGSSMLYKSQSYHSSNLGFVTIKTFKFPVSYIPLENFSNKNMPWFKTQLQVPSQLFQRPLDTHNHLQHPNSLRCASPLVPSPASSPAWGSETERSTPGGVFRTIVNLYETSLWSREKHWINVWCQGQPLLVQIAFVHNFCTTTTFMVSSCFLIQPVFPSPGLLQTGASTGTQQRLKVHRWSPNKTGSQINDVWWLSVWRVKASNILQPCTSVLKSNLLVG